METLLSAANRPMLKVTRKRAGGLTIEILPKSGAQSAEILAAIESVLSLPPGGKIKG